MVAVFIAVLVLGCGSSSAANFQDAEVAYEHGDYASALQIWRDLAEQGDAAAQNNIGYMYENGQGTSQDYTEAVKWWRRAAAQGVVAAQHNLGVMYATGRGVPHNDAEAVKWYRLAAERGFAKAQHNLAVMYEHAMGVPRDYVQAYMWFDLAAAQFRAESEEEDGNDAAKDRDAVARKILRRRSRKRGDRRSTGNQNERARTARRRRGRAVRQPSRAGQHSNIQDDPAWYTTPGTR